MKNDSSKPTILELKASQSTKGNSGPNLEGSGFRPVENSGGGGK